MVQDPYKVLGLSPGASQDEIKKAYRKKTEEYHPDLHPNDPTAASKMAEVNEAYDMLMNPEKYAKHQQQQSQRNTGYSQGGYQGGYHGGYQGGYQGRGSQGYSGGGYQGPGGWTSDFGGFDFGGPGRKFCVSDFRQSQEFRVENTHYLAYFPCPPRSLAGCDGMRAGTV